MTPHQRWKALLWEEWLRRRARCEAAMADAKAKGDLAAYRAAKARWDRFYARADRGPRAG